VPPPLFHPHHIPLAHHPAPDDKAIDANAGQHFIVEQRHRQLVVSDDGAHHFGVLGDAAMLGLGGDQTARGGVGDTQAHLAADGNGAPNPVILGETRLAAGRLDPQIGAEAAGSVVTSGTGKSMAAGRVARYSAGQGENII